MSLLFYVYLHYFKELIIKKRAVFALCLAAVFAGCRTGAGSSDDEKRQIQKYKVQFSASPEVGGIVSAKTKDGNVLASGSFVEKGTEIVFTAVPKDGYYCNSWDGPAVLTSDTAKRTAKLTITADAVVTARFEKLNIERQNWKAHGTIKDADGKMRDVKLVISDDGKYFSIFTGESTSKVFSMTYMKNNDFITFSAGGTSYTLRFLSRPQTVPSDWNIRFETDLQFGEDDDVVRIKAGTESTVKVTYNNNNLKGAANAPFIN